MDPATPGYGDLGRQRLYVGLDRPDDPRLILENAEKVADAHGPDHVFDYLYRHARAPQAPREVWTRQVLVATCVGFILQDFFARESPSSVRSLFAPDAATQAARAMSSPRGVLALTFHGGFAALLPHFFIDFLDDSLVIDLKTRKRFGSVGADDPGAALFGALCALRDGRSVYLAPDGPLGKLTERIQVLGVSRPVSDSAAFLAFETSCDTVWYDMRRNGRLLVPVAEPGPSRAPGETFKEFRMRLMEFYRSKIEEHFTGDPQNLAVCEAWRWSLKQAMREEARAR